jgi:hypothetical protein
VGATNFNKNRALNVSLSLLRRMWPFAALAAAALVNVLWAGVLIYAVIRLLTMLR